MARGGNDTTDATPPRLRIALVESLSLRGKELRRALPASGLAVSDVVLLDRADLQGTLSEYDGEPLVVFPISDEALADVDVALFCGESDQLAKHLTGLAARDAVVMDLGGRLPLTEGVRVVVARVNQDAAAAGRRFRNPDAATIVIASLLAGLGEAFPVLRADAAVFAPVAEKGEAAIEELTQQTVEVLSFRSPPTEALGARIAFNVVPSVGKEGALLEGRLREELAHVLGAAAPSFTAVFLRVPVFLGIGVLLDVELEEDADAAAVRAVLAEVDGLVVRDDEPATPGDLPDADDDPIWVSVSDGGAAGRVRLWAVADLLRRGSIANALATLAAALGR